MRREKGERKLGGVVLESLRGWRKMEAVFEGVFGLAARVTVRLPVEIQVSDRAFLREEAHDSQDAFAPPRSNCWALSEVKTETNGHGFFGSVSASEHHRWWRRQQR